MTGTRTPLLRSRWAAIGAAVAVTLGGGGLIGVSAAGSETNFVAVTPTRLLDTRGDEKPSGNVTKLQVSGNITLANGSTETLAPADATAASINLTATEGIRNLGYGFVTAYPCTSTNDRPPNASSLNFTEGVDIANGLNVSLGASGAICLYVYGSAHLIVDLAGYYVPAGSAVDAYTKAETDALVDPKIDSELLTRTLVQTDVNMIAESTPDGDVAVAVGHDGNPVVAFRDVDGDVGLAVCNDPECSDPLVGTVAIASGGGGVLSLDIAIGRDGFPLIAYRGEDEATLELVRCLDASCVTARDVILEGTENGDHPSIMIGAEGNPIIAYGRSVGEVDVAFCEDSSCDELAVFTIDDGLGIGNPEPDLAIDADGNPFVAYTDRSGATTNLVVTSCASPTSCSAFLITETLSTIRDDGQSPAVTIGFGGHPIIANVDETLGWISLVICLDLFCRSVENVPGVIDLDNLDPERAEPDLIIGTHGAPIVVSQVRIAGEMAVCGDMLCQTISRHGISSGIDTAERVDLAVGLNGAPVMAWTNFLGGVRVQTAWWMAPRG